MDFPIIQEDTVSFDLNEITAGAFQELEDTGPPQLYSEDLSILNHEVISEDTCEYAELNGLNNADQYADPLQISSVYVGLTEDQVSHPVHVKQEISSPGSLQSVKQELKNAVTPADTLQQTGIMVNVDPFAGCFDFNVTIQQTTSKFYAYSSAHNLLYANMDKVVPVIVTWNGPPCYLRAMMVFNEPDEKAKPVNRCHQHGGSTDHPINKDYQYPAHVLRCDNDDTLYTTDPASGRHSVVNRIDKDPNGANGIILNYRFMCSTSCGFRGINRRKTSIIFTPEDAQFNVLGRAILGVKICACPMRDMLRFEKKGEEDLTKKPKKRKTEKTEVVKRESSDCEDSGTTNLQITVPGFPANKIKEFKIFFRRLVSSYMKTDEDVARFTAGVDIKKE